MAWQIDHPNLSMFGQWPQQITPCMSRRPSAVNQQQSGTLLTRLLHMPAHTTCLYKPAAVRVWPIVAMRWPVHG